MCGLLNLLVFNIQIQFPNYSFLTLASYQDPKYLSKCPDVSSIFLDSFVFFLNIKSDDQPQMWVTICHLQHIRRIQTLRTKMPCSFIFVKDSNIFGNKGFFRLQKSQVLLILISNSCNNSLNCFSTLRPF